MKDIHIGQAIQQIVLHKGITQDKIEAGFPNANKVDIQKMYDSPSLESDVLLKWCKLCSYNFFMIYNTHLQIYAPAAAVAKLQIQEDQNTTITQLHFNKCVYSNEVKEFILELVAKKQLSIAEIIEQYHIPKTTIYKWIKKKDSTTPSIARDDYQYINKPNYAKLYLDMAAYYNIALSTDLQLAISKMVNTVDVLRVNKTIFQSSAYSLQQGNAYQEADVLQILKFKREYKLSNSATALHFKMSRNTISRWEKLYGAKATEAMQVINLTA